MTTKRMSLFLVALLISAKAFSETATLISVKDGKTTTRTIQIQEIKEGNTLTLTAKDDSGYEKIVISDSGEVLLYEARQKSYAVDIKNEGGELRIQVQKDGSSSKSRLLKRGPFFGTDFSVALRLFAKQPDKPLEFWTVPAPNFNEQRLFVISKEEYTVLGEQRVLRAKLGLTGFEALFWSAQVWIDSRGRLVKFVGNRGPGTPTETIDIRYSATAR